LRYGGNDVWSYAYNWTDGDDWLWYYRPKVTSTSKLNGAVIEGRENIVTLANYGGTALNQWHDAPQTRGTGQYSISSHFEWLAAPGCDPYPYTVDYTPTLSVSRPTINSYGALGVWWLGGGSDPGNGYYNQVALAAQKNCLAGDSCTETPVWSKVETGAGRIAFNCTTCESNVVTSQHESTAGYGNWDITIKFSIGGFESEPLSFYVNAPYYVDLGNAPPGQPWGDYPLDDGYESIEWYSNWDRWGNRMPSVALNNTFGTWQPDQTNNWNKPSNSGTSGYDNYYQVWSQDIYHYQCPTCNPAVTNPQTPLSGSKVDHSAEVWRIGNATPGNGVAVQTDTLQRYVDHGRQENVVTPVGQ